MTTSDTSRLPQRPFVRRPIALAIVFLLATRAGASAAHATDACPAAPVVTTTADSGSGSLRQAIADACAVDTITFAPGIGPSIDLTSGELVIDKDLMITGPGAKLLTVQRASSVFRIFHILPGHEVTITDVTIANGLATGLWPLKVGGGIYNDGSTLTVERAALSHNAAPDVNGGSGGAIQNSAATANASLTIVESTLSDNTAGIGGGAVESISGVGFTASLTIANSTFSGNSAGDTGCLLVNQNDGVSTATITNATITGNHATLPGTTRVGGLRAVIGTTVTVHNSIIAGNITDNAPTAIAADVDGTLDSSSANNLVGDGSNMAGIANGSNGNQVGSAGSPIDPRLGLLADNGGPTFTHALLAGSPALDAGNNTLVVGLSDQRGVPFDRIVDAAAGDSTPTVDIGAVEANPSIEDIADKTASEDTPLAFLFAVDADTLAASSSNAALVKNSSIGVVGVGGTRTLTITPEPNTFGATTVTLVATRTIDGVPLSMSDTFVVTVRPVADPPSVTSATTVANVQASGLMVVRNSFDGAEVTHFEIANIVNGVVSLSDGTPVADGQFITAAQGAAGLRFTPAHDLVGLGSFQARGATDAIGTGLGSPTTAFITVNKHATVTTITAQNANPSNRLDTVVVSFSVQSADGGPEPTGAVTVTASGGESCIGALAGGSGQCSVSFDTGGVRTLTATYTGDALSLPGTGVATQTVSPCPVLPVVTTTADSGPGSLRQAIADACTGEAITFDPALGPSIDLTSGELLIDKDLIIVGPGANALTVQRTSGSFRIFHVVAGASAAFTDLTIANGEASGSGTAGDGGAILNEDGSLLILGSTLRGNAAVGRGGAISSLADANPAFAVIVDSTLSGNAADTGGAVFSAGGETIPALVLVANSTISGNAAQTEGSALELNDSLALIGSATIANNVAALAPGGAIRGGGSDITLQNSIVAGNRLGGAPGIGQDAVGDADANGSFNNLFGDGTGMFALTNGVDGNQVGTAVQPIDARLGPLADNGGPTFTHALLPGSPALDAGDNTLTISPNDQRGIGFARVVDAADADAVDTVDIGAFEAVPAVEDIANRATIEGTPLSFLFNVANADTVTVASSNSTLVPNAAANLAVSGGGSTPMLTIAPAPGQSGTATITVTATKLVNGLPFTMADTFVLTVTPVAHVPTPPPPPPPPPPPSSPPPTTPDSGSTPAAPIPLPPGAPAGLAGTVSGAAVALQWIAPSSGDAPTTYVIEAGRFTGFSDVVVFPTGTTATTFSVDGVDVGTYFVRVRARNGAGTSRPSNEVVLTVGAPPTPDAPGAPTGLAAAVVGSTVTLSWQPPTPSSGGSPTRYQVEAGSAVGLTDLSNFSTNSTATSVTVDNVPPITYFVRVRSANANGLSAPSNETIVVVGGASGCVAAPIPPSVLASAVDGSTVHLAWTPSALATSYIVAAGTVPGASDVTVTDTGTNVPAATAANVGAGTYFVRVSARNACGTSSPSNEVAIVVP